MRSPLGGGVARATRRRGSPRSWFHATLFGVVGLALTGCIQIALPIGGGPTPLQESVVYGERGPKVLMLEIAGPIRDSDEPGSFGLGTREGTVARVRAELDLARKDAAVKAVLLRIDSPGGTVTASDIVYHEILRFKEERKIPVVAQLMGVAASGGYYVAMSADAIWANPTTLTGSIGVIFAGVNVSGLMDKLGIADQTLVSGDRKDTGSPLRPMRPDERAQLQGVLDQLHARFESVVAQGRPTLGADRVRALSDGRIYTAEQARDAGLVDAIGYLPDGIAETKRRAGLTDARVIVYRRARESSDNIYSQASLPTPQVGSGAAELAASLLPSLRGPSFLYLWWPAAP